MRPSPRLLVLLVAWSLLGLGLFLLPVPMWGWQLFGGVLGLLLLIDGVRLYRQPSPQVSRRLPDALALNVERPVSLTLQPQQKHQDAEVHDLYPGGWEMRDLPQRVRLTRDEALTLSYRLKPTARGDALFAGVQLRLRSPWRLWRQSRVLGMPQRVRVYPDFAPLARFALLSAEQASRLMGAHLKRRRGEGTDFNQMREYRVGDSLRQIDWKATARSRKLISREYQDEKNQQLVMMLDTGRRMLAREGTLGHFDHVLNAALVVSYLALRQGDAVGLFATGGQRRWVPPQRGPGGIDQLLRASYDLQPQPVATDYLAAASEFVLRQRRRALVMLSTNVRDEDIEDLLAAVRLLGKRHLVCVASLRESVLDAALSAEVDDLQDAVHSAAVARYLEQRAAAHDVLRSHRVMVLDVTAEQLPGALVERYLAVKRDGLL
jgi:uncharacterized protein (DUF58 family)